VLPPEGASMILFRDPGHAPQLARSQGGSATELRRRGVVDELVAEGDGLSAAAAALERAIDRALAELTAREPAERLAQRQRRLRELACSPLAGDGLRSSSEPDAT
jgi:acetyl-CoA carboxylase alpha subunit